MKKSNIRVEQVNNQGNIDIDYGEIWTPKELSDQINLYFKTKTISLNCSGGNYNGIKYCICFKNISYLGTPHPIFKKRIQIPKSFVDIFNNNKSKSIRTLFLGVYNYKEHTLFVDFDTTNYIKNKAHNSSAHVLVMDLVYATLKGIYAKEDIRNNKITVFTKDNINLYLQSKLIGNVNLQSNLINIFDTFFYTLPRIWNGINCYEEMILQNFNQKFQPEWPGFYLEFKLSNHIMKNNLENEISYIQNKKDGQIDLDLYFPQTNSYGDLKAHSINTSGIQGNDYDTILNEVQFHSIYYIVLNHETIKDSENNYNVTIYWNTKQGKENKMSYSKKMKAKVILKSYMILEINKSNIRYLTKYHQGKNSNGKERNPKIIINKKELDNFIIHFKKI